LSGEVQLADLCMEQKIIILSYYCTLPCSKSAICITNFIVGGNDAFQQPLA